MKYLITQSLLSAWLYLFNCSEDNSEEARKAFLASLCREATEQSEEMLRGISFEDAVNAYLHGDNEAPERHAAEYSKRGGEAEEAECVRKVAEIMRGGTYQLQSYDEIFEDMGVSARLKSALIDFMRHLGTSYKIKMINSRLERLLVELDMKYGSDDAAKCKEVRRAIVNGYKRLECEEVT